MHNIIKRKIHDPARLRTTTLMLALARGSKGDREKERETLTLGICYKEVKSKTAMGEF